MNNSDLFKILENRFKKNMNRHPNTDWESIQMRLESNLAKLAAILAMEETGGEPDVVEHNTETSEYTFFDCSAESPKGRRSLCYDHDALHTRKEYKPLNSAMNMAAEMGVKILTPEQYHQLQGLGKFDTKTSSWLETSADIRALGGAIFGDFRYGKTFIYHNGAESYYAARGFRASLTV